MKKFTALHLSDLHLSKSHQHDQKIVLSALFKDLKDYTEKGNAIDAVFFTGDLIAKGDYKDAPAAYIAAQFIRPLVEATKVSTEKIFLVPGNHDVETKKIDPICEPYFATLSTSKQVNELIDVIDTKYQILEPVTEWFLTSSSLTQSKPIFDNSLCRAHILNAAEMKIGIACINSAWRSSGKPKDYDYGKLLVGERQVELLSSALKDCDLKLALIHHPLSWLAPFDQHVVQRAIFKNFDALLHGHNHVSDASSLTSSLGHLFTSNAGCLYQAREYFNGYSILSFIDDGTSKKWEVHVREYYETREVFDISSRYAEGGFRTHIVNDDNSIAALFPTPEYIGTVQERVNAQMLSYSASEIAPKSIKALFVEPPLSHVSERQIDNEGNPDKEIKYLTLGELAKSDKAIFFVGRQESGKTTLLNYLCVQTVDISNFKGRTHSFYVNLKSLEKCSRASILEAAGQFCGNAYRKAELISLLKQGRVVFCFDNLPLENEAVNQTVSSFVSEFNLCKFFFTINEGMELSITNKFAPKLGVESEVVYLHAYSRKHTRQLIQNWFPESIEQVREKLDAVLLSIRKLNVPQNPFLISILLWIHEKNIQFTLVNQAEIIDTFIDGLLEKLTESKNRDTNDSTIKRHFLSELAFHLFSSKRQTLSINELERFTVRYFEEKALISRTLPFIQGLFAKGILLESGDEVSFKFECFRAFFLAKKIEENNALRSYALTRDGFLELKMELDYYTGLYRDRVDILTDAVKLLDAEFSNLAHSVAELDLSSFRNIGKDGGILSPELKEAFQNGFLGKPMTLEEQEKVLDDLDAPSASILPSQQKAKAAHITTEGIEESKQVQRHPLHTFSEMLTLSSQILRNSELVNDASLKHEIYTKLNRYWSVLLLGILTFIEEKEIDIENHIRELMPEIHPEVMKYLAQLSIPNVIFAMVYEAMGTNKLEKVVKDHLVQDGPILSKIVSAFLLADLGIPGYVEEIGNLLRDKNCTRYTIELIFFKLLMIYTLKSLHVAEARKVENLIGDVFVHLGGNTPKRVLDLQKDRLIGEIQKKSKKKPL